MGSAPNMHLKGGSRPIGYAFPEVPPFPRYKMLAGRKEASMDKPAEPIELVCTRT